MIGVWDWVLTAAPRCTTLLLTHRSEGRRFIVRAHEKPDRDFLNMNLRFNALTTLEIASMLMRLNRVARRIINANHCIV